MQFVHKIGGKSILNFDFLTCYSSSSIQFARFGSISVADLEDSRLCFLQRRRSTGWVRRQSSARKGPSVSAGAWQRHPIKGAVIPLIRYSIFYLKIGCRTTGMTPVSLGVAFYEISTIFANTVFDSIFCSRLEYVEFAYHVLRINPFSKFLRSFAKTTH